MDNDWKDILIKKHTVSLSVEDLTKIISGIQHLMRNNEIDNLDDIFNIFNKYSSTISLVCALRSTFVFRDKLPCWKKPLINSSNWMKNRGENPDSILKGLF